jgi:hypothetical protein
MWMSVHTWRLWKAGQEIDFEATGWLFDAVQTIEEVFQEFQKKEIERWQAK